MDTDKKSLTIDDFTLLKVVGKGSYGTVMLARKKDSSEVLAIKMLKKSYLKKRKQETHTLSERWILETINHPFIVNLKYAFQNTEKLYFALEFCPGGELFFHLQRVENFDEEVTRFYSAQMVLALEHLHKNNVIYRDLKPENVLIHNDGYIKLTDFGLAKENVINDKDAMSFCGTPEYLAPEILERKGHGKAVDWWSLASIIYEMIVGLPPFYEKDNREKLFKQIKSGEPEYPDDMSAPCKDLLQGLFKKDPAERIGGADGNADEIKNHPWYSAVDWDILMEKKIIPPFKPKLDGDDDTKYIDNEFTEMVPFDSAADDQVLESGSMTWKDFTFEDNKMKVD
jgi:serum/glucocorticoid-regulated kinase 2